MPTRKEDNDDERLARIDAMVEMHQKRLDRSEKANVFARRAQARARLAVALAVESLQLRERRRRTRKRA